MGGGEWGTWRLLLLVIACNGLSFPDSQYLPVDSLVLADQDLRKGEVTFTVTIVTAANAHDIGGVTGYEIRFASSPNDRFGRLIELVNTGLQSLIPVNYSGPSRDSDSDDYPDFIVIQIFGSDDIRNPVAVALPFTEKAAPRFTPITSSPLKLFDYVDTDSSRDSFQGDLTIYLDTGASLEDDTIATINLYNILSLCGDVVWTVSAIPSGARELTSSITFDNSGGSCAASINNTFTILAANDDGNAFTGVAIVLDDLVPAPAMIQNLPDGTLALLATLVPEKTLTGNRASLAYGDNFQMQAQLTHPERGEFLWNAFWQCGDMPVLSQDFGTNSTIFTSSDISSGITNPQLLLVQSSVLVMLPRLSCPLGFTLFVRGSLFDVSALNVRGPEHSGSAKTNAVVVSVSSTPEPPFWVCELSNTHLTIIGDDAVGLVSGTLTWDVTFPIEHTSIATGRSPDFFFVSVSSDEFVDMEDEVVQTVQFNETLSTFSVTFEDVEQLAFFLISAHESAGDGASVYCNTSVPIPLEQFTSLPPTPTSAIFVDISGEPNRISGVINVTLPTITTSGDIIVSMESSQDLPGATREVGRASFLLSASDQYVEINIACNADFTTGNSSGKYGCDLFDSVEQRYYDLFSIIVVSSTVSKPLYRQLSDRHDAQLLLEEVALNTGTSELSRYLVQAQDVNGRVLLSWTTASLTRGIYVTDTAALSLMNLTNTYTYDIALGDSSQGHCHLDEYAGATTPPLDVQFPPSTFGGPDSSFEIGSSAFTIFLIVADFAQLLACGFIQSATNSLHITGLITLRVLNRLSRGDSPGSQQSRFSPQLSLSASVDIVFRDNSHASLSAVSVTNMLSLDSLSTEITLDSTLRSFSPGFLSANTDLSYLALQDTMYFEHSLDANGRLLFLSAKRVWFGSGPSPNSPVQTEFSSGDPVFTNIDEPAFPGRYRFATLAPLVINCQPCYMHIVSEIQSSDPAMKGLADNKGVVSQQSTAVQQVHIDVSGVEVSGVRSQDLVGVVLLMVSARLFN